MTNEINMCKKYATKLGYPVRVISIIRTKPYPVQGSYVKDNLNYYADWTSKGRFLINGTDQRDLQEIK